MPVKIIITLVQSPTTITILIQDVSTADDLPHFRAALGLPGPELLKDNEAKFGDVEDSEQDDSEGDILGSSDEDGVVHLNGA